MKYIPYGHQDINQQDVQAVLEVLTSEWLTQGPSIERFEQTVAEYCGAMYAVAVNSATAALHIACLAAGLGKDDMLWTSPNTFVASANCGLYCGAEVDFIDIDSCTYNISVERLEQKLQSAKQKGKLPKVIIPVHFSGQSCEMQQIQALAKKYGCRVIEDASHAIGGSYLGSKIGSCAYSDMTVFSFHPVKIVTTGEGGMILTNHRDLYEQLVRLRSHGITRDPAHMQGGLDGSWYYQQVELGFNYRMTDMQAALGISQMRRIDEFISKRHMLAKRYNEKLAELPLVLPYQHPDTYSAWHLYVIKIKQEECKNSRRQVFDTLRCYNIGVNVHYIPVHTQPYYQKLGFMQNDFPQAEQYYQNVITIPLHYALTEQEQDYVIECLYKCTEVCR